MVVKLSNGNIVYFWWPGDRNVLWFFKINALNNRNSVMFIFFPINIKTEYFEDKILFALEHVL